MEIKPKIKSIPYEEFKDNATLEKLIDDLHEGGVNVVTGSLDQLINWGRSNSLWSLTFATSCCGIEFMACGCSRYDFARFGFEVTRNSPRQADLIMCAGTLTHKMAPALKRLYDEMAEPKYVIAVGGCAISGGPFKSSYHVVKGIEEIVPVDVFIPGCPPRPEAIMYGMMQLQRKVKVEKFFGGVNHKQNAEERLLGKSNEELIFEDKLGISVDETKEKRAASYRPAPKPAAAAKPAAKPAPAAKKETIVVDKAPTAEQVENLGKVLDQLKAQETKTSTEDNNNK